MQTPHRFRTKRQLWAYSGLALETHDSAEYHYVRGELRRRKKQATVRGLNHNHNHDMKGIFESAATQPSNGAGPLPDFLCNVTRPRDEALDGSPHFGAQNCNRHFSPLEERSGFQCRTAK
jgi:hypothetical protein